MVTSRTNRDEPTESAKKKPGTPLTRQDWIDAGNVVLISHSIDAVQVKTMAKGFGVTIGSFYHHFKNRDELLQAILENWRLRTFTQVGERLQTSQLSCAEFVTAMLELPFRGRRARTYAMVELAIRSWARREERARVVVEAIDAERLKVFTNVFASAGLSTHEAANRAFILYSFQLTQILVWNAIDSDARQRQLDYVRGVLFMPPLRFETD